VMGKAAVVGIIVAEQSNDTEIQPSQLDSSTPEPLIVVSDANIHKETTSGERPTHSPRTRGPKAKVLPRIIQDMLSDIKNSKLTREELNDYKEEPLAARYSVSRDTVRKARNAVLHNIVDN